jgi:hypothetical protein
MYLLGVTAFLFILLVMPESPKWLLINGRANEAREQFKTIARFNGVPFTIPEDAIFIEQAISGNIPAVNIDVFNNSVAIVAELMG